MNGLWKTPDPCIDSEPFLARYETLTHMRQSFGKLLESLRYREFSRSLQ